MIAERCDLAKPGTKLNAACRTCGHTLGAHTDAGRCDVCDVLLFVLDVIDRRMRVR